MNDTKLDARVIGIDLGTSGIKLVMLAADGTLEAEATAPLEVSRPRPLWSEQSPADWWAALDIAMRQLREAAGGTRWAKVRGMAAAGQMHGAVLLDAAGEVLRPAILWNDGRSQAQCDALEGAEPATRRITANRAMAGFTAPKLLWVAEHEPELFTQTARVLLPKDWLAWKLTGVFSTEMSDASGTLWLDVARRRWSDTMLQATGLNASHMPMLFEGPDVVGELSSACSERWGLPAGVLVAAGAGDNAAGAVGVGVVAPGDGFISLGTSGVVFCATEVARANPERGVHTFCHALPDTWHHMGVLLSASSALSWWSGITGLAPGALMDELGGPIRSTRTDAPFFLPYLSGERTPHADPAATGSFIGLTHAHGRSDMSRAVIEGVSFAFADALDAMREAGSRPARLLAIGGGARSDTWLQLLADVLGTPIDKPEGAEVGPALGAARLALMGLGMPRETVLRRPAIARSFLPDAAHAAALAARLQRFRAAYAPLRALNP
jgi:xylulokinase